MATANFRLCIKSTSMEPRFWSLRAALDTFLEASALDVMNRLSPVARDR